MPIITKTCKDFTCFTRSAYTEIHYKNKKVVGSAQRVYQHAILQHGSILIGQTHKRIVDFLKAEHAVKKKIEQEFNSKTICLSEIKASALNPATLIDRIIESLASHNHIKCYFEPINHNELNQACQFITQKIGRALAFHEEEIELY